jgi:hypothetical protein
VRRLRYEDFVADPRRTVRELVAFAGLPVDADALRFLGDAHADLSHGHSAAGNPMRFTAGRVPVRADELWRSALPTGQRRLVAAISAPMLRRYGYRLRPAGPAPAPPALAAPADPADPADPAGPAPAAPAPPAPKLLP